MKAVQISRFGGPEHFEFVDVPDPSPGPGEVLVDLRAIGVNYRDVTSRSGEFPPELTGKPMPPLPYITGSEGAGIVSGIGEGVTEVQLGDRVAFHENDSRAYAEKAVVRAWRLVTLPDNISFETGAAIMLQGLTAEFLAHDCGNLEPGDIALVHSAAGGTGLLLTQMLKRSGIRVIGTVSTDNKAVLAKEFGADYTINYRDSDFSQEVLRLTEGVGVQAVYDAVGVDTFDQGVASLATRGHMVMYGNASGPVVDIPASVFLYRSLTFVRAAVPDYTATRDELMYRTERLFEWLSSGELRVHIHGAFPLKETSEAHRQLEGRLTSGKVLLIP
ncbi:quinone oxidoreductase [SAR202 cluster bacterium AD-804-J14_MRT_500m]|nr:quinone oxidoreductase [SAR202 cluster bacterium AD-804-J14_MRT_500m]